VAEAIVTISEDGSVTVEAKGVVGQGCQALTKAIENAIGQTTGDVKKPEYFQQAGQANQQKAQR
jgi:hypothetical protein